MAMYNSTFCFIDETKLTEEEWNKVHAEEVADHDFFPYGYFHCFSYVAYSASFDRCMAHQIKTRDELRDWYKRLTKRTYTPDFHEVWSDFSDIFKGALPFLFALFAAAALLLAFPSIATALVSCVR